MTIPVSAELLIALNKEHGGPGAGVADRGGVEACAARPFSGYDGVQKFPTIWEKAAALLHGIASTQNFTDGNKRTAVVATLYFLEQNGESLRKLPRISKEAAVLSVATSLLSVQETAEWLYANRLTASDRIDYAFLGVPHPSAKESNNYADWSYQVPAQIVNLMPGSSVAFVAVVARINWFEMDRATDKTISIRLSSSENFSINPVSGSKVTGSVVSHWDDPIFPNGFQSWNEYFVLKIDVRRSGQDVIQLLIDGEVAWRESLTINQQSVVPDYLV